MPRENYLCPASQILKFCDYARGTCIIAVTASLVFINGFNYSCPHGVKMNIFDKR